MTRRALLGGGVGVLAVLGCGQPLTSSDSVEPVACGTGAVVTEMDLPGGWSIDNSIQAFQPDGIVTGADGNLWMTEVGVNAIGRLRPDGRHDSFPVPDFPLVAKTLTGIVAGPDGNVWFAECANQEPSLGGFGVITPDGVITQFTLPDTAPDRCPMHPAVGPDGNVWFSEWGANGLGRVTPDGTFTEFFLPGTADWRDMPTQFAVGPDGNFWFGEIDRVGRLTTAGDLTFYSLGIPTVEDGDSGGWMTSGPGRQSGWTAPGGSLRRIALPAARDESIQFKAFLPPAASRTGAEEIGNLIVGPDGNLWYAGAENVGCFTVAGAFHNIPVPSGLLVGAMTLGPDGALWFTEPGEDRIGRVKLN